MDLRYLRLFILCIVAGVLVSMIVIPFRWLLLKFDALRESLFLGHNQWYWHIIILLAIWCVAMLIAKSVKFNTQIRGSGIPQSTEIIIGRLKSLNPLKNLALKFCGGLASIGIGLSLSRGGPSVEIGTFVGRIVGNITKTNNATQRYLQAASGAAGLSASFSTPLSATVFMIEGVARFNSTKLALTTLLATGIAGWSAKAIFPTNDYSTLNVSIPEKLELWKITLAMACFAIIISFIGKAFNFVILYFQNRYTKSKLPISIKILAIVFIAYVIGIYYPSMASGDYFHLGYEPIDTSLWLLLFVIILKMFFTAISYSAGFPGGIFLPLLVIGGLTGKLFGLILVDLNIIEIHNFGFFIVLGMAALFATSVRTPITGILFTIEITQQFEAMFPTIIFVGVTYFVSQLVNVKPIYNSLYNRMIGEDLINKEEYINVEFTINEGSYIIGKTIATIKMPEESKIIKLSRSGESISLESSLIIDDIITISIQSNEFESLFETFRAMTNE